jgi:ADP-ribose pyrophosphatase YjhB (NUDIX family)
MLLVRRTENGAGAHVQWHDHTPRDIPIALRLMNRQSAKYCRQCGTLLARQWVATDVRDRLACPACGHIHYENPRILVTCLIEWNGLLLLCKRAQPPAIGRWTIPGGFMEMQETLELAVARETMEETGVVIDPAQLDLHIVSSVPWMSEVYLGFRTIVADPKIAVGPECLDVRFFDEAEIPWDDLAFPETRGYLRLILQERRRGRRAINVTRIDATGGYRREYHIVSHADIFQADVPTSRVGLENK